MHNLVHVHVYINNHGTLDHTDDDKTNDLGSNPPEDTFFT